MWRYETCGTIEIDAPLERVYALASDPKMVPLYAEEVRKIEIVQRTSEESLLVRSYLTVGGMTFPSLYKYHYRPPRYYGGIQQSGRLFRGYFRFTLLAQRDRTTVAHTEGILSSFPGLAWVAGFICFRLISRRGIQQELRRLKELVEQGA